MKEIKKETKIIVGISITVVLLAIIATVVVLAVKSVKRGSQLLSHEYVWVDNDDGEVTMLDGLFVAAAEGGYVLVNEDKVVSAKYADLRLVDAENKIYEFSSFDGNYGRIDGNGKELISVKASGDFIGDTAKFTDYDFCVRYENGGVLAGLCEKRFDRIYKHSQIEEVMSALGSYGDYESVLPSGIFFAKADGKYYIVSSLSADNMIELSGSTVVKIAYGFVTLSGADGLVTYALPSLEKADSLDGISGENIFGKDGKLFYFDAGRIHRVGGEDFEVSFKPEKIIAAAENKALFVGGGQGIFYDNGVVTEGRFEDLGVIYRVGSKLVYADTLGVSAVENETLTRINSGDKIFFLVGEVVNGTNALYEYKNGALEFKSDAAYTTYKNSYFESSRYKGEYEVYFMYGGKVYDTDFNAISDGIIVRKNLILKGGNVYTDLKGGNEIRDVERFYDVYDFAGNAINEYLYVKKDGLYTSNDSLLNSEFDSAVLRAFKAENGAYVFVTEKGIVCSQSVIYSSEYNDCVLMSKSNIALISDSQVRVVKATKRGFETVSSYGFFSASLDGGFKSANGAFGGVTFGKTCAKGVVFGVGNGKSGFVDADGRLVISPAYDGVYVSEYYAVLANGSGDGLRYAATDFRGRLLTDFEYTQVLPFGNFMIGLKADGTAEIINSRGNNVAKNIVFGDFLSVENYVTVSGRYVEDGNTDYLFVNVGGKYRLLRTYN